MIRRVALFSLSASAAVFTGGCAKEASTPTILDASDHPYVGDLPLPVGFTLVERHSEEKASAGRRAIKHVYQGRGSLQAVKNFYQHYMPQSEWIPIEHSLNRGVYLLRFQKGRERCEVRIERMPSGLFGSVTQIRATLQPDIAETPG
jgi:hypothetical protein